MPHLPRLRAPTSGHPAGFSLAELLVGAVISGLVLAATVLALLSLLGGDRSLQQELNRKDDLSRVLGLLQDEVRNADRVESGASLQPLSGCTQTLNPQLILYGTSSATRISYALQARANDQWRGPNVLVRCGPPYKADGTLDTAANPMEQTVLDTLQANGFTATGLGSTGTLQREVRLTLISNASGTSVVRSLQVPINANQIYALGSASILNDPNCTTPRTGCVDADGTKHSKPSFGDTVSGSASQQDVIYLDARFADVTLGGIASGNRCVNGGPNDSPPGNCTIRLTSGGGTMTITYGDLLVFTDTQIKLPGK
jgi:hypothetical protein